MGERPSSISRFMAIFAGGTLLSRVLGLARDAALGAFVPPATRDAFFLAFQLPNMLRDMFGEGAANAALIPVFSRRLEQDGEDAYRRAVRAVLGVFVLLFLVLTAAGVALMPLAPGAIHLLSRWSGGDPAPAEDWANTVALMQWTFPYLMLIGLAAFATAPLFIARHYFTPSWSPALLNLALIGVCFLPVAWFGGEDWALVAGVWIGGVAQLAAMLWAMRKHAGVLSPSFNPAHPDVGRVMLLLGPVILGQSAGEVNKLIDRFFAIGLETGVVTALYFSNRLIQLPLALFGIGVSVAILPEMSRAMARGDVARARDTLVLGLRQSFFLLAPAAIGLAVLGEPIIRVLFERGHFTAETTRMTYIAMAIGSAGLVAFGWIKVCAQGFYALEDSRTPVKIAAASMIINIALNFLLVPLLQFKGLALASTLAFSINFLLLFIALHRRYGRLLDAATLRDGVKIMVVSTLAVAAGAGIWAALHGLAPGRLGEAMVLGAALAVSGGLYFVLAGAAQIPEASTLLAGLRRRLRRT